MGSRSGDRFKQCIEVMKRQERNEMSKRNSKTRPQMYQPKTKKPKRMALQNQSQTHQKSTNTRHKAREGRNIANTSIWNSKYIQAKRQKPTRDEKVAPARACKTNNANVSRLPKKTNEAIDKTIAKNNTTEQLYIQCKKLKTSAHTQTNNYVQGIYKHDVKYPKSAREKQRNEFV